MMKLYLVDSSIYIFKAWFSLPDTLVNQQGQPNNAWLGFVDFMYQFLSTEKPRKLVFAFDESLKYSVRKEIYPQYKANRLPAPEELRRQFQWCREWVRAIGISEVASDRHEADDLIGSLATYHRNGQTPIVILTADKDLAQLIREDDIWWSYATGQQLNYRSLIKRFGVKPEQIADQLAIAGDKVDNIPGIPGIGMTLAGRLLTKFGDITNLRNNLHEVKNMKFRGSERIMRLLQQHEAILDISARLTPVDCEITAMQQVTVETTAADLDAVHQLMQYHQMGERRQQQWLQLIATRT